MDKEGAGKSVHSVEKVDLIKNFIYLIYPYLDQVSETNAWRDLIRFLHSLRSVEIRVIFRLSIFSAGRPAFSLGNFNKTAFSKVFLNTMILLASSRIIL